MGTLDLMKPKRLAKETLGGLRRNVTMSLAMVVTVAISLTLLGAALLIGNQVDRMKGYWYDRVEVSVFLCNTDTCTTEVTPVQRDAIEEKLKSLPEVATVYYESKQEAYDHFREQYQDSPDLVGNVDADALPESFRVKLKDAEQFQKVATTIQGEAGVEEVVDQRQVLERFFAVMDGFQKGSLVLAVLLVLVAAILISNTVQAAAYSRRKEIGIMRLVGASNWSIRLPFLLEGIIAGVTGSLIAFGALSLLKKAIIDDRLAQEAASIPFIGWSTVWGTLPILLVIAIAISATASALTIRKHLKV